MKLLAVRFKHLMFLILVFLFLQDQIPALDLGKTPDALGISLSIGQKTDGREYDYHVYAVLSLTCDKETRLQKMLQELGERKNNVNVVISIREYTPPLEYKDQPTYPGTLENLSEIALRENAITRNSSYAYIFDRDGVLIWLGNIDKFINRDGETLYIEKILDFMIENAIAFKDIAKYTPKLTELESIIYDFTSTEIVNCLQALHTLRSYPDSYLLNATLVRQIICGCSGEMPVLLEMVSGKGSYTAQDALLFTSGGIACGFTTGIKVDTREVLPATLHHQNISKQSMYTAAYSMRAIVILLQAYEMIEDYDSAMNVYKAVKPLVEEHYSEETYQRLSRILKTYESVKRKKKCLIMQE